MPKEMVEASSKKKHKKKLSHLQVREGENGGHVVTHHFTNSGPGEYHEPEDHVFGASEGGKMLAHVGEHMGVDQDPEYGESEEAED